MKFWFITPKGHSGEDDRSLGAGDMIFIFFIQEIRCCRELILPEHLDLVRRDLGIQGDVI